MQLSVLKSKKYLILRAVMFFVFLFIAIYTQAQGPGSGGLGDPPEVPVDGGLTAVLAVGVGYGAKKLREYRKK